MATIFPGLFAKSENFADVTIDFRVDNNWTVNNRIDKNTIKLNRYQNLTILKILPTTLTKTDINYSYFTAVSPSMSYFTITAEKSGVKTAREILDMIIAYYETKSLNIRDILDELRIFYGG